MTSLAYELPPHVLLTLRGERVFSFLQDVCAQNVAGLGSGQGAHVAFLDPKGLVLADAVVLAGKDEVLVVAEETCVHGLERAVMRVAPLAGVEAGMQRVAAARVIGGDWADPLPTNEHDWTQLGDGIVVRVRWGADGHDLIAPSFEALRSILAGAGVASGDPGEAEVARIADGRPRYGLDLTEDTLVNETPLLERAVAADKGCYPGQESVARVRNLGRVRRRLAVLDVPGPPPPPGTPLLLDGAEVGQVTSAAEHSDGSGSVALARVRSEIAPGAVLQAGSAAATVR